MHLAQDTLDITSFTDPKVSGVTLYVSDFSKSITDRLQVPIPIVFLTSAKYIDRRTLIHLPLQGDFFSDPSTASITCVRDGPVKVLDSAAKGLEGEEVFSEAKSLLFKSVKVKTCSTSNLYNCSITISPLLYSGFDQVRRVVDVSSGNVVYISYSQKVIRIT